MSFNTETKYGSRKCREFHPGQLQGFHPPQSHSHLDHHYQIASDHIQIKNTFNIFGTVLGPGAVRLRDGLRRGPGHSGHQTSQYSASLSRVWALIPIIHIPICVASRARRKH